MIDQLPPPLTPPGSNLTDFEFMPLQVARLRKSKAWLICKRRPELGFYLLNLWTAAWHERPAGSLEDDDDVLADVAMCSPENWPKVKEDLLRGWVKCSDGRLYHPVVAEKVIEAWQSKREYAYDKERDRLAKALKRAGVKKITDEMLPDYASWDSTETSGGQFSISGGKVIVSGGHPKDTHIYVTPVRRTHPICPPENALKGEGEGEGQGKGEGYISDGACPADIRGLSGGRPADEKGRDPDQPTVLTVELTEAEHHARFLQLMAKYPAYAGAPNPIMVEATCRTLVGNGEETWDTLDSHAERFWTFVDEGGRSEPRYVDHPLKFFKDPVLRRAPWDPPKTKAEKQQDDNIDESLAWLREEEAKRGTG